MVVLSKIYTRTGDDGTTALGSGRRVSKFDLRVECYGTLDETNAAMTVTVSIAAEAPAESAEQENDENDNEDESQ